MDTAATPSGGRHAYDTDRGAYLARVRRLFGAYKHRSYLFARLDAGQSVLDVGCGTGEDVQAISFLVGQDGRVTGLDSDATLLPSPAPEELAPITFVEGDATALPFEDSAFDRVRSDRLFQHLSDQAQGLSEMRRVVKQGGIVVAHDVDWGSLLVDSEQASRTRRILHHACSRQGHGWTGRTLYRLFKTSGLMDVEVAAEAFCFTDLPTADFVLGLTASAEAAVQGQAISQRGAEAWIGELHSRHEDGTFFASLTGFGVRGSKQ